MKIHIVFTLTEGCVDEDSFQIYKYQKDAIALFEKIVIEKGFPHKFDPWTEKFEDYLDKFWDWEHSDECPYDPADFEIHILRNRDIL